jgi:hypothetical protein
VRYDAHDGEASVEEDGVDRIPHEPRVDRVRRTEKQAFALAERRPSEQAAKASERCIGDETSLARGPSVHVLECDLH